MSRVSWLQRKEKRSSSLCTAETKSFETVWEKTSVSSALTIFFLLLNHFKIQYNSSMIWVFGDAKAVGYSKEIFEAWQVEVSKNNFSTRRNKRL